MPFWANSTYLCWPSVDIYWLERWQGGGGSERKTEVEGERESWREIRRKLSVWGRAGGGKGEGGEESKRISEVKNGEKGGLGGTQEPSEMTNW